jgi:ATP synthase protein I
MTKGGTQPGAPDGGDPAAGGRGKQGSSRQRRDNSFRPANAGSAGRPATAGMGYTYLSYMLGGMLLYGFIGWLVGRWTHQAYLLPVGMIFGLALSIVLIIYRVTRPGPGTSRSTVQGAHRD